MEAVLARDTGLRHYLLGGSPKTMARLQQVIARRFPAAQIVGAESPPFRTLSPRNETRAGRGIRDSAAQIVWVGLGTPKQDLEVQRLAAGLPVVAMAVGAASTS